MSRTDNLGGIVLGLRTIGDRRSRNVLFGCIVDNKQELLQSSADKRQVQGSNFTEHPMSYVGLGFYLFAA